VSILVDKNTRVLVQGITGKEGAFHAARCKEYGTQVVGGVTPGKGGTTHEGFAVWNTVEEAVKATGADCALIFVPPPAAADAVMEAADAGVALAGETASNADARQSGACVVLSSRVLAEPGWRRVGRVRRWRGVRGGRGQGG
jgi:succinyl-CoA synthetase alpha subunit